MQKKIKQLHQSEQVTEDDLRNNSKIIACREYYPLLESYQKALIFKKMADRFKESLANLDEVEKLEEEVENMI